MISMIRCGRLKSFCKIIEGKTIFQPLNEKIRIIKDRPEPRAFGAKVLFVSPKRSAAAMIFSNLWNSCEFACFAVSLPQSNPFMNWAG